VEGAIFSAAPRQQKNQKKKKREPQRGGRGASAEEELQRRRNRHGGGKERKILQLRESGGVINSNRAREGKVVYQFFAEMHRVKLKEDAIEKKPLK